MSNILLKMVILISSILIITACGEEDTSTNQASTPTDKVETIEVIKEPGSLILYSGRSEKLVGPIVEQFQRATGIEVKAKYGNTAEIAALILEEGSNSPADIFFAQDSGGLGAVAKMNMFKTLDSATLDKVPVWAKSKLSLWIGLSG